MSTIYDEKVLADQKIAFEFYKQEQLATKKQYQQQQLPQKQELELLDQINTERDDVQSQIMIQNQQQQQQQSAISYPSIDEEDQDQNKYIYKKDQGQQYQQLPDESKNPYYVSEYQQQQQQQKPEEYVKINQIHQQQLHKNKNLEKLTLKQKTDQIQERIKQEVQKIKLSRKSQKLPCQVCKIEVDSEVRFEAGEATGFLAGACLITTVILAPVPYCINATKDAVHYCPYCTNQIAKKHAWKLSHLLSKMTDQTK